MNPLTQSLRPFARPHHHLLRFGPRVTDNTKYPNQWIAVYGWPKLTVTRPPRVAICELGGQVYSGDVQASASQMGSNVLPQINNFSALGGQPTTQPNGADGEVALDVQAVMGICYSVTGVMPIIDMVWAPNSSQGMAAATSLNTGADSRSWSWGSSEQGSPDTAMDQAMQVSVAAGCDVAASSGDNDSGDGQPGNNVDFPASSPWCIGCGGTTTILLPSGVLSEAVWNDGTDGTGGGVSKLYPQPSWQKPFFASPNGKRGVPDIAGPADPATGWIIFVQGQAQAIGGTSAVSPMIAALIACLKAAGMTSRVPFLQMIYALPVDSYNDVTVGNNGAFKAGPGYDPCTGRGTPSKTFLTNALNGVTVPPPVIPPQPPVPVGITLQQAQAGANAGIELGASHLRYPYNMVARSMERYADAGLAQVWATHKTLTEGEDMPFDAKAVQHAKDFQAAYSAANAQAAADPKFDWPGFWKQWGPLVNTLIGDILHNLPTGSGTAGS